MARRATARALESKRWDKMPEIRVVNIRNQEVGTLSLRDEIFNVPIRPTLLHEVVVMQQNNRRQGTAATKTRGLVSGGGRKPWKQKGTGRARSGSNRSPVWVGGGTVFGPQPRDYGYTMPRKKVRAALLSALSSKVQENQLVVVDAMEVPGQKTKEAAKIFRDLGIRERALLVATPQEIERIKRGVRNLSWLTVLPVERLNVYDLLRCGSVIMTRDSVATLQEGG